MVVAVGVVLAVGPSPVMALTKPERKAVDIKRVDARSEATATFVEIKFKGEVADELGRAGLKKARVTTELVPASGPTTTITDRKSSEKPKEQRKGTSGPFDVVREGNEASILVEELPGPIVDVTVTSSGPGGDTRGAKAGEFDQLEANAKHLETVEDIEEELFDVDDVIDELEFQISEGVGKTERERLEQRIALLTRWSDHLESIVSGETLRQCNDGVDNGDPEDTIVDHPTDPGCVEPVDNDEKNEDLPVDCPAAGATAGTIGVINTPQSNAFTSFILRSSTGAEILRAPVDAESAGPTALPGAICGPGANVNYEFRQYADGDPFGLPDPPAGDRAFRIVIFVDNPGGSGNPGDLAPTLGFAVGTVPTG